MLQTLRAAILALAGRLEEARQSAAEVRRPKPNLPTAAFGNRLSDPAMRDRSQAALVKEGI